MRVTQKGQVTIPIEIREKLRIFPNSEVEFILEGGAAILRKTHARATQSRGKSIVRHLKGKATAKMTTKQIMSLTRLTG